MRSASGTTTHNLAQLLAALGLDDELLPVLPDLARRCFEWICRRQQLMIRDWRAEMQNVKNSTYAWRQMIFYLSIADADEVPRFLGWTGDHLAKQRDEFRDRFAPATNGLQAAVAMRPFDRDGLDCTTGGPPVSWLDARTTLALARAPRGPDGVTVGRDNVSVWR